MTIFRISTSRKGRCSLGSHDCPFYKARVGLKKKKILSPFSVIAPLKTFLFSRSFYIFLMLLWCGFTYHINTNEIPSELLRENLISSHVKKTYPHMWTYHRSYSFIINRTFQTINIFKWNGLVFNWCLYNK